MFSLSHLHEKAADRAMIAEAVEAFFAKGREGQSLKQGEVAEHGGKRRARQFVVNPITHEKVTAKPLPAKKPASPRLTPRLQASIEGAKAAQVEQARKKRELMAVKVSLHAGLGDSERATAEALEISRNYLRRIAKEFSITFKTQA